jgi:hypothetical protein
MAKQPKARSRSRVGSGVDVERQLLRPAAAVEQRGDGDERHRHRREQERRPDDRTDRDIFRAALGPDDRHDWDPRLGQRGRDCGENPSDRPLMSSGGDKSSFVNWVTAGRKRTSSLPLGQTSGKPGTCSGAVARRSSRCGSSFSRS